MVVLGLDASYKSGMGTFKIIGFHRLDVHPVTLGTVSKH